MELIEMLINDITFAQCGSLYAAFSRNLITTENKRKCHPTNIDIANYSQMEADSE